MTFSKEANETPQFPPCPKGSRCGMLDEGLIHLCQPDSGKSCGACCGIYNYADSSRESLTARLRRRTEMFRRNVREGGDLNDFSRMIRAGEDQKRSFEVIHCCEYAGFLDDGERRVGCLLHPAQNRGIDLRDASFYGQELCDGHICPSNHFLSLAEKRALIYLLDDWYLYGLCLTDIDLVKGFFRHLGDSLGETPDPERFRDADTREAARRFFDFKINWQFRSREVNRFGRFYFDGSQYMIRPIDYHAIGCEPSRFDGLFLSLTSVFFSEEDLRKAEGLIAGSIAACAVAYTGAS